MTTLVDCTATSSTKHLIVELDLEFIFPQVCVLYITRALPILRVHTPQVCVLYITCELPILYHHSLHVALFILISDRRQAETRTACPRFAKCTESYTRT